MCVSFFFLMVTINEPTDMCNGFDKSRSRALQTLLMECGLNIGN
jgi:hypothetical protein